MGPGVRMPGPDGRIVDPEGSIYDPNMVRVCFTPNLRRYVPCPSLNAPGDTVGEVLAHVFTLQPRLKSYVLDDQARLRRQRILHATT